MQQLNEHALSPTELRREEGDSSSLGVDASSQKSRSCLPGKEKIEALRGLGIRSFASKEKNLSALKSKPDSIIKLPSSKDKSNSARSSLKSKRKAKGEVHLVILPPFPSFCLFLCSLFFCLFFYLITLLRRDILLKPKMDLRLYLVTKMVKPP